jgi:hypothetical protein
VSFKGGSRITVRVDPPPAHAGKQHRQRSRQKQRREKEH